MASLTAARTCLKLLSGFSVETLYLLDIFQAFSEVNDQIQTEALRSMHDDMAQECKADLPFLVVGSLELSKLNLYMTI